MPKLPHPPERIWLQAEDDGVVPQMDWTWASWCQERVFPADVEYIRKDLVRSMKRKRS